MSQDRTVRGFTFIELLVVIAIMAIMASLLLPALARSKKRAQRLGCTNHEKQMQLASLMYSDDDSKGTFAAVQVDGDDDQSWLYPQRKHFRPPQHTKLYPRD